MKNIKNNLKNPSQNNRGANKRQQLAFSQSDLSILYSTCLCTYFKKHQRVFIGFKEFVFSTITTTTTTLF